MDITSQETMQLLVVALIAGTIGAVLGVVNLRSGRFSYIAVILAPAVSSFLMCAAYFAMVFFSPVPPENANLNHFEYAFISTCLIGIGLSFYGSIPAVVGNVVSQLICNKMYYVATPRRRLV